MEVLRWTVRMAKDRKLFTPAQFEFSARALRASPQRMRPDGRRLAQEPWRSDSTSQRRRRRVTRCLMWTMVTTCNSSAQTP
jgi:hypothetical protein